MEIEIVDNFRKLDKAIKSFLLSKKKCRRHKKSKTAQNKDIMKFSWTIVIDCDKISPCIHISTVKSNNFESAGDTNLINPMAQIFQLDGVANGLYIIRNGLTVEAQMGWAKLAIEEYSLASHTNLTNLKNLKMTTGINDFSETNMGTVNSLWRETLADNDMEFSRFKSLRWACLGYHYDWTSRMYKQDLKSPFPKELADLCNQLANFVGLELNAEAGIVNYYPEGACMGGHIDDAEHTMEEPIVSISIGCPAIFLIGGTTKDVLPTPILIRSGDVVIMSGDSRKVYHGVASVISHEDLAEYTGAAQSETVTWASVGDDVIKKYLEHARINMNVRRVVQRSGVWIDKCATGSSCI